MEQDIINKVWPKWQTVRKLGAGSYGSVYEAVRQDHNLESRAAVKIISIPQNATETDSLRSEGMSDDSIKAYYQGRVDDFVNEIKLMESLKGTQNIVSVEDYAVVEREGAFGSDIYIRMELLTPFIKYMEGKTLTQSEVIKLGADMCMALELCSKRGIIHRDVKPENIFVNDFGDYKLGDFGIARRFDEASGALSQKGTYNYMAPEVAKGERYDASVDIYSLGVVMYRLLNENRMPFLETEAEQADHNTRMQAIQRRLNGEPLPRPKCASAGLSEIVLKACDPDPKKRYGSPEEMREQLMNAMNENNEINENGTGDVDVNKTVSVRQAPQGGVNTDQSHNIAMGAIARAADPGTFTPSSGSGKGTDKNRMIPILIGVIAVLAVLVAVLAIRSGKKDDTQTATANTVKEEEELTEDTEMLADADSVSDVSDTEDASATDNTEKTDSETTDNTSALLSAEGSGNNTVTANVSDNGNDVSDNADVSDDASEGKMTREQFDSIISEYDQKYSNTSKFLRASANSYELLFIDDDDIPELLYSDSNSLCIVNSEGRELFLRDNIRDSETELYYLEKEGMILLVETIPDQTWYVRDYYYYKQAVNGVMTTSEADRFLKYTSYEDSTVVTYRNAAVNDAPKEMFDDYLVKYESDNNKFKKIPLDYSEMHHRISEAGDDFYKEHFEN
ncbi:MAG: serine/threonine protein kinase [Lachnospiraceae bacterium]|nr:serine/threonine protein kinase [Lachnospiraceae bacterium]